MDGEGVSKGCHGVLNLIQDHPPSPKKQILIIKGIAGLRSATPAMTRHF